MTKLKLENSFNQVGIDLLSKKDEDLKQTLHAKMCELDEINKAMRKKVNQRSPDRGKDLWN